MPENVEDALRRPVRYWMDDGIVEITLGLFALVVGLTGLYHPYPLIALPVLFGSGLLMRSIPALKRRLTFPRTGYVKPRPPRPLFRWVVPMAAATVAVLLIWLLRAVDLRRFDALITLAIGVVLGAFFCRAGHRLGLARFYALGFITAAAGGAASLMRLPLQSGIGLIFAVEGAACVISGLLALRGYLKAHPQPTGEQQ